MGSLKVIKKLTDDEIVENVSGFSDPDWTKIETIHDQDRWVIQKCRLAGRLLVRLGKKKKKKNMVSQSAVYN